MSLVERFLNQAEKAPDGIHIELPMGEKRLILPVFVDLRKHGLEIAVSKYPITNLAYESYLGLDAVARKKLLYSADSRFSGPTQPAVGINFKDAEEYCDWMSTRFGAKIELPSRDLWEAVARAGESVEFANSENSSDVSFANLSLRVGRTSEVNQYPPNKFGIHDLTGNVLEWTSTIPTKEEMRPEYGANPVRNDRDLALNRVLKGGCWAFSAENSRISANTLMGVYSNYYTTGFRPIIRFS